MTRRTRGGQARAALRRSEWEYMLEGQLRMLGVPTPAVEFEFAAPERRWRFDFAWRDQLLAVEVEGGIWAKGKKAQGSRHTHPSGFVQDLGKYNAAAKLGWKVLRYTDKEIRSWAAAREIAAALGVEVR